MSANGSQQPRSALFYKIWGSLFQLTMLGSFMYRSLSLRQINDTAYPFAMKIVNNVGGAIFVYCLYRIYVLRPKGLITTGVFKYTRHPMYTGLLMMATRLWWPTHHQDAIYWVSLGFFLCGVFTAGYLQEKETIARFGQECLEYYARTPRLFFLYPFWKR